MLLNRYAERAALGRLLDAARAGHSGVLVVRGVPVHIVSQRLGHASVVVTLTVRDL